MTLETVYIGLFLFGLFFAIGTVIFSVVGLGGHGDMGGAHTGGEMLGHGDIVGGEQTAGHELHFTPFSLPVIATFVTGFGGGGYLSYKNFGHSPEVSVLVALLSGLAIAALLFTIISKFLVKAQSSSEPRTSELVGTSAEVTVGIPKGGTGEIGYTTMGTRYTAPAVSASGDEVPARSIVRIERITAGLFHVEALRK